MTAKDSIENYKEVSPSQRTAIEKADAEWTAPDPFVIIQWESFPEYGRRYNPQTGYFEGAGLFDLTETEVVKILSWSAVDWLSAEKDGIWALQGANLRTNIVPNARPLLAHAKAYGAYIENLVLSRQELSLYGVTLNGGFLPDCKKILTPIQFERGAHKEFSYCNRLEEIYLFLLEDGYATSLTIDLSVCKDLNASSLEWMVTHSKRTTECVIALHPAVYARIPEQLMADATEKQIQFTTT